MALGAATKGITIQFRGDTTNLGKAMTEINRDAKQVDKALREVNRALKFNPGNTDLIAQKQTLLKEKIEKTKEELKAFERAQKDLDDRGVEKTSQEYMEVQRRIIEANSKLEHFNAELKRIDYARVEALGRSLQNAGQKMKTAQDHEPVALGHPFAPPA
jgi:phage-related minor tail protein